MSENPKVISDADWELLSSAAWKARSSAFIHGDTAVGAAVLSDSGSVFAGCNAEHHFRSHDIHAETNAIGSMVAAGHNRLRAVLVVADRHRFTPCGACLDWIFEFGDPDCAVGFQKQPGGAIEVLTAGQLMPYYPC